MDEPTVCHPTVFSPAKTKQGGGPVEHIPVMLHPPTDAVFISLGRVPMTQMVQKAGIEVDQRGCIKVDRRQRTNVEGVFAAGDCTCGGMQIVTAAGEGATAAIRASTYVKRMKKF